MKAAVLEKTEKIVLRDVNVKKLDKDEVLVRVKAAGICGTDRHIFKGKAPANLPLILGHEIAGLVEEVGPGVTELSVGDRVAVDPNIYCGQCFYCRRGEINLCTDLKAVGVTCNGGFAEYVVVPVSNIYKLSSEASFEVGAMIEPISCCLHGIDIADIKTGDFVVILGGGAIGQLLAQLARIEGASNVIISEPDKRKRDMIKSMGFSMVVKPDRVKEVVFSVTNHGADIVIEAVGREQTIKQSVELVRRGGTCVFFGVCPENLEVLLSPFKIYKNEITIKGSYINPFVTERSVKLLDKLEVEKLITNRYNLNQLGTILKNGSSDSIKSLIVFD